MKFIVTFCVVLAGCSVLTEATWNAEKLLLKLKEKAESISNDLETYSSELSVELNEKLSQLESVETTKVEASLNDTTKEVNERVETAQFEGKQVGHCFETFKAQAASAEKSVKESLKNCIDDKKEDFENIQKNIQNHLKTKETIVDTIDETILSCKNDNAFEYQLCIAKDLPSATALVGGYYSSTVALKESARIFNYTVSISLSVCFLRTEATFSLALLSGKMSAEECIQNA